jgi:hypothetical protein
MKLAVTVIQLSVFKVLLMRHAQPRPSMTYIKLFFLSTQPLCSMLKLHKPLVSECNFMDPWPQTETSCNPGLASK